MRHFSKIIVPALVVLGAAAAPAALRAQVVPGSPPVDWRETQRNYSHEMLRNYNSLMQSWREAWQLGDAVAVAHLYSPDAGLVLADGERLQGRAAIQKHFEQRLGGALDVRTGLLDFVASGRMAYATGPLWYQYRDARGQAQTVVGHFVVVLVKEEGQWKIRSQVLAGEAAPNGGEEASQGDAAPQR